MDWSNSYSPVGLTPSFEKKQEPPIVPPSYAEVFHALQKMVDAFGYGPTEEGKTALVLARKVLNRV